MTFPLVPHPEATKEQRRNVLTATDLRRIAAGDWHQLWLEKTGQAQPADLSHVWKVRLGQLTENLHLWWHETQTGHRLHRPADRPHFNPKLDVPAHWATTLDAWVEVDHCPIEVKHTNENNDLRSAANYYMPQLQWQMLIADTARLRFSIIRGNAEPDWGWVARDESYLHRLRQQADAFWSHVVDLDPPPVLRSADPELQEKGKTIPLNGYRPYDFTANNAWIHAAHDYRMLKPSADQFKEIDKQLRDLIPADASELRGGGLAVKRDKRGACRITIEKE